MKDLQREVEEILKSAVEEGRELLAMPAWMWPPHELMNQPLLHRSCMPAGSGII
ncbi:hypothetical protein [Paenibacillus sp. YN15]|uniref:hypothetical protein n=1 Tax=Paenibacillus sp. YN15 TaxID=1742774 RepID=UPI0015EC6043|nr:hypothetical protein [Paenibacillus sp. YN15]